MLTHIHMVQGVDGWDVDLPTMFEANLVTNAFMKVAWVFVYLGVYGLRPVIIRPKPNSKSWPHLVTCKQPADVQRGRYSLGHLHNISVMLYQAGGGGGMSAIQAFLVFLLF